MTWSGLRRAAISLVALLAAGFAPAAHAARMTVSANDNLNINWTLT